MSKSVPQLTEKTDLATGDLLHIVRSNVDYKIKKENFETQLAGAISKTYAEALVLITNSTLIQGRFYLITDKADAGILVQAVTTNAFSLHAIGLYYVPDFQDVGLQTGNMMGVWYSGLGTLIANVSIAIYNGLHYKNLTGNVGTAPSGDAVNWVLLAKTLANGYILDEDLLQYNFTTDTVNYRSDKRGNYICEQSLSVFQLGNDSVARNITTNATAYISCLNSRGTITDNSFGDTNVVFANTHEGSFTNNVVETGGDYDFTATLDSGITVRDSKFNYMGIATPLPTSINLAGVTLDFDLQYTAPTTGQTKTALANTRKFIIDPAAGIAALTITLDATNLYNGKTIELYFTQTITTLTVNGGTIVGALPAGITAAGLIKLVYYENTSKWYY